MEGSEVWSFKTRKSQGLPLNWNLSQLNIWAHKCHHGDDVDEAPPPVLKNTYTTRRVGSRVSWSTDNISAVFTPKLPAVWPFELYEIFPL